MAGGVANGWGVLGVSEGRGEEGESENKQCIAQGGHGGWVEGRGRGVCSDLVRWGNRVYAMNVLYK